MGHAASFAHHGDYDIGLLRRFDGFIEHDLRRARVIGHIEHIGVGMIEVVDHRLIIRHIGAPGVGQRGLFTHGIAQPFTYSH